MSLTVGAVGTDHDNLTDPGRLVMPARIGDNSAASGSVQGSGFSELVDILNPLQHIPGVAQLYRAVTGDEISESARMGGNALYGLALGGPIGLAVMAGYSVGEKMISDHAAETADATPPVESGEQQLAQVLDQPPLDLSGEVALPASKPGDLAAETSAPSEPLGVLIGTSTNSKLQGLGAVPLPPVKGDADKPADAKSSAPSASLNPVEDKPAITLEGLVSNEAGLEAMSQHSANVLPLDVLQALQSRHAALINDEQS